MGDIGCNWRNKLVTDDREEPVEHCMSLVRIWTLKVHVFGHRLAELAASSRLASARSACQSEFLLLPAGSGLK